MARLFTRLLCVLALMLPALAAASTEEWTQTRSGEFRGDISVWTRDIPGQSLKAFRGRVDMPYTMLEILAALADIEQFPEWVFQCSEAAHRTDLGDDVVYIRIKGIWPVNDRDAVTRTRLTQLPDSRAISIHTWADNALLPEQKNTVRMPQLENLFILEPQKDGWTRVTFQTFANPGGYIPFWVANMVTTRAPLDTLSDLREHLKNSKYHISSYRELPFLLPGLEKMVFDQPNPRGRIRYRMLEQ